MSQVRVLIADDEALIRHALRHFVNNTDGLVVVAEAADGAEAISLAMAYEPDVILMDLRMPKVDGVTATERLVSDLPCARILAVTTSSSEEDIVSALRAGVSGYLIKNTTPDVLVQAIRAVHDGKYVISPNIAGEVVRSVRTIADRVDRLTDYISDETLILTPREHSIVRLLAEGLSNSEIAHTLAISEATVKSNLGRTMRKWDVRDRIQVLIFAAQTGIVSL